MIWKNTRGATSLLTILIIRIGSSCSSARYAMNTDYPQIPTNYVPDGSVESIFCPSSTGGPSQRRTLVYLPPSYNLDSTRRYPVFYLLHGARGNEVAWITKGDLLKHIDSLVREQKMIETIVVLPNMNQYNDDEDYGKSRYKNAMESFFEIDGSVESGFMNDIVGTVDRQFRTIAEKSSRAIAGMSLGAMQAIHISASNPDSFDYVGLFSPLVHPFYSGGENSAFFKNLKEKQKAQFANPPKLYWVMVGRTDILHQRMNLYDKRLSDNGYPHEYYVSEGGHEWYNWTDYCDRFMKRLWKE